MNSETDVAIVGGGPVGLYLAILLLQKGIQCRVYEQKDNPDLHSKSLGIHPISLDLFDRAGITDRFLESGVIIRQGVAFWNREEIGTVTFDRCPPPHRYILAIPQWQTERILEEELCKLDPDAIQRGAKIEELQESEGRVHYRVDRGGEQADATSRFLIGCDGKNSPVRKSLGIPFTGGPYPDTYIMGDFSENTDFGSDAAIWLHEDGLVEAFPLPGNKRRWVVKTTSYVNNPQPEMLKSIAQSRTGISLEGCENSMMSSFGVQHLMAQRFHDGRILLAGDAAHVVSPIGGQGMNLGWLDAEAVAEALFNVIRMNRDHHDEFRIYTSLQRRVARQTALRAELNMHLGRRDSTGAAWKVVVKALIKSPARHLLARIFTMRGLGTWPV